MFGCEKRFLSTCPSFLEAVHSDQAKGIHVQSDWLSEPRVGHAGMAYGIHSVGLARAERKALLCVYMTSEQALEHINKQSATWMHRAWSTKQATLVPKPVTPF